MDNSLRWSTINRNYFPILLFTLCSKWNATSFVTNSEPVPIYMQNVTLLLRNKKPRQLGTIPFLLGMNRNNLNCKGTRPSEQQWICQ